MFSCQCEELVRIRLERLSSLGPKLDSQWFSLTHKKQFTLLLLFRGPGLVTNAKLDIKLLQKPTRIVKQCGQLLAELWECRTRLLVNGEVCDEIFC